MAVKKTILVSVGAAALVIAAGIGIVMYAASIKAKQLTYTDTRSVKALYAKTEDTLEGAYGVACMVPGEVVSKLITYQGERMVQVTCTDQRQPINSDTEKAELQKNGVKFNVDAKTAQDLAKFTCSDGSKVFYQYNSTLVEGKFRSTYECATGPAVPAR